MSMRRMSIQPQGVKTPMSSESSRGKAQSGGEPGNVKYALKVRINKCCMLNVDSVVEVMSVHVVA